MIRIGLPSGPRASSPNASAYLRPSWKMWPISMARSISSGAPHRGHGSPAATVATPLDVLVDHEVTPHDCIDDVVLVLVGPGDPCRARADARVGDDAHAVVLNRRSPRRSP